MRSYFEKPRTSIGWKGLINDPDLDESFHVNKGLRLARKFLLDVNNLGLPTASEYLDTQIPQHIADLTSWVAIGARTTESQVHRELASGSRCGRVQEQHGREYTNSVDAVVTAASPHWFPSVTKQACRRSFKRPATTRVTSSCAGARERVRTSTRSTWPKSADAWPQRDCGKR